ncbi:hypothetical protein [Carnobacterium maltaromaticum]|uniref:hypothetical protein n=1 Tax=Carnobacterium maltaromaticum TaxID=2751 RepID=UPI0039AF734B
MDFDWNSYYNLAKELSVCNDEAKQRTAISRAYYSAYRLMRDKVSIASYEGRSSSHADVWNFIGKTNYRSCKSDGFILKELRQKADYDANMPDLEADCEEALILAEQIINKINN